MIRHVKDLCYAAIPTRVYYVLCILALLVASATSIGAIVVNDLGYLKLGGMMEHQAKSFWLMPLWFLIGGSLQGVAFRIDAKIENWRKRE